jgi:exodeoxyribonuclease V gamma subunit
MSDEAYPRRQSDIDFDLMRNDYRPGDRSRRDDDRYLFLEALLSARDKFTISWVGRSAQDNSEWPPSVLVAQLRDHLVQGWCPSAMSAQDFLRSLTTEHRLQAFHPDYMIPETGLITYASEWQAAQRLRVAEQESEPLQPWRPQQDQVLQLSLNDLVNFMCEPAAPFFTERLHTVFKHEEEETHDSEIFSFNGLQQWQLSHDLLTAGVAYLRDETAADHAPVLTDLAPLAPVFARIFAQREREGALGVRAISQALQASTQARVSPFLLELSAALQGWQPMDDRVLSFECSGDVRILLEHRATQLFQNADGEVLQLFVTPSERKLKYRCRAYLMHLLLCTHQSGLGTTLGFFGDGKKGTVVHELARVPEHEARQALAALLAAYAQSLSQPSGVVGQLALEWIDNYWKAISGTLTKKTPPMAANDAQSEATRRLLSTLEDPDQLILGNPYAVRIQPDLTQCVDDPEFWASVTHIYAPLVRLEQGQSCTSELPEWMPEGGAE